MLGSYDTQEIRNTIAKVVELQKNGKFLLYESKTMYSGKHQDVLGTDCETLDEYEYDLRTVLMNRTEAQAENYFENVPEHYGELTPEELDKKATEIKSILSCYDDLEHRHYLRPLKKALEDDLEIIQFLTGLIEFPKNKLDKLCQELEYKANIEEDNKLLRKLVELEIYKDNL